MMRYKIVRVETPYAYYHEIYERFLGFLWWKKWKGVRIASYVEAVSVILKHKITYCETVIKGGNNA